MAFDIYQTVTDKIIKKMEEAIGYILGNKW